MNVLNEVPYISPSDFVQVAFGNGPRCPEMLIEFCPEMLILSPRAIFFYSKMNVFKLANAFITHSSVMKLFPSPNRDKLYIYLISIMEALINLDEKKFESFSLFFFLACVLYFW